MTEGYFHRVHAQSATRFWINNPSLEETDKSIAAGAVSCTTNPTYVSKLLQNPAERVLVHQDIDTHIKRNADDESVASAVQRAAVKRLCDRFLSVYEATKGADGFVSIQISPHQEDDSQRIVSDARQNRELAPNIIAKIPTTAAGLEAMRILMKENVPIIATEIMAIDQAVAVCEMYREISSTERIDAPLYVTHISGIFDEYLRLTAERDGISIPIDILFQAGCAVARKQYTMMKSRGYPGILLGGGARGLHHFTEMVGGEVHVTINWKGAAETLVSENPPVVWRMENPVPWYVIQELMKRSIDFRKAYQENALQEEEFADFGPVELFRSMFIRGWDELVDEIARRRRPNA